MNFIKRLIARDTEQVAEDTTRLTDTQRSVLVGIYAAPTPETAYSVTTGAQNVVQAKDQLRRLGLITVNDSNASAGVTDAGQQALGNYNLIDDTGEVTDEGSKILDQISNLKAEFKYATESFKLFKTLL